MIPPTGDFPILACSIALVFLKTKLANICRYTFFNLFVGTLFSAYLE
jgi:hypothetical protein